jgi:ligand-binding sensor domain-containing protein
MHAWCRIAPNTLRVALPIWWCGALLAMLVACTGIGGGISRASATPATSFLSQDLRWSRFPARKDGPASSNVMAILSTRDVLWFGTQNGVTRYDGQWQNYSKADVTQSEPTLGMRAPHGQADVLAAGATAPVIWAGTTAGAVAKWNGTEWYEVLRLPSPILALLEGKNELWIGTEDGLYRWVNDEVTLVEPVGRQPVYAFLQDGESLWVGTEGGLWHMLDNRWLRIGSENELLNGSIYALEQRSDGTLLLGTPFGLVWRYYAGSQWYLFQSLDEYGFPASVRSIAIDERGGVWSATDGAGLYYYELGAD